MSRIVHLKIKIKSLSAESRIIRAEERKALRDPRAWVRFARDPQSGWGYQPCDRGVQDAVNNVFLSLRDHRVHVVRNASRHSQLAYGFLRGRPYAVMESRCRELPDWEEIRKIAARFCIGAHRTSEGYQLPEALQQRWETWRQAADLHISGAVEAA